MYIYFFSIYILLIILTILLNYIHIYIIFFLKFPNVIYYLSINIIIIYYHNEIIIFNSEMANQGRKLPQPPEGSTF